MRIILSSARRFLSCHTEDRLTEPVYLEDTKVLLSKLQEYNPWELQEILRANEALSHEAFLNYQEMDLAVGGGPALFSYSGLVYKSFNPESLSAPVLGRAQENLRLMSGFYGALKPFDRILPYRLELMSKLTINGGNLYQFWGDKYYKEVFDGGMPVVNLGSEEYAKAIRKYLKKNDLFIDIVFLTFSRGKLRVIVTETKAARGKMAAYILSENIRRPEALQEFDLDDYRFEKNLSSFNKFVFIR